MKAALSFLIAAVLFVVSTMANARGTGVTEAESFFYQKGNVTLVVMVANDDCCHYDFASAGWVASSAQAAKQASYRCYLSIGEVDVALACYRNQEKGRVGTRVINSVGSCPADTVMLLASTGAENIIQDFEKSGYPDGCNAHGCPGNGEASG